MVLAELGGRISRALQQMSNATLIDEKVLAECLNEISRALLQADVQFKMVMNMQNNIKKIVNLDDLAAGHNKRKIIQQVRRESLIPPPLLATVVHWWDLNKNRKFPLYSSWIQIHSCSVLLRQCSMNSATCLILGKLLLCQRKASRMSSCLLDFRVRVSFSVSKARVCCTTTWDYNIERLKRECGPSICFELVLCVYVQLHHLEVPGVHVTWDW